MASCLGQTRIEVAGCLAASDKGGEVASLAMFGPLAEEKLFASTVEEICKVPEEEREGYIVERLKSLVAREEFIGLSEIHPAWLVEVLSKESPRIVGIILRYLPSKQVRYIIEHLPKRIKHKLPQLIDSFAVPSPVLEIIKERFERQFITSESVKDFDEFEFKNIPCLKTKELEVLFRDLGTHELAMALKGVERSSLNILFNRLSVEDARALQQRIRSLVDVSPSLLRDAKYTVLEMSLMETNSDDLLMDIGLNAFARAIQSKDISIFPILKQKLEPRLGYTLKRYIDEHVDANFAEVSRKRKELILGRIKILSQAGSINEGLAGLMSLSEIEAKEEVREKIKHTSPLNKPDGWHAEDGVV